MTDGVPVPPDGVPHLISPENLPPGTTVDPSELPAQSPNVTYLKEIWHAIQTQDITGKDALLALTQRPLTTPDTPGGPSPLTPGAPVDPAAPTAAGGSTAACAAASARLRANGSGGSDPLLGAVGEELVLPHR